MLPLKTLISRLGFELTDDEYQQCSPAHVGTGATHLPDGR